MPMRSSLHAVTPDDSPASLDEERMGLAQEFLIIRQGWDLFFWTFMSIAGMLAFLAGDVWAIFHIIQQKTAGDFGEATEDMTTILTASSFTVVAYFLVGVLFQMRTRWSMGIAAGLYLIVLFLLAGLLIPSEIPNGRAIWASVMGNSIFASLGATSEAPTLFLALYVSGWAVVYSLFGLAFCWAKICFIQDLKLWNGRSWAGQYLALQKVRDARQEELDQLKMPLEHFGDHETCKLEVNAILRRAVSAYQAELESILAKADAVLREVDVSHAEKVHAKDVSTCVRKILKEAQALII